MSKPTKSNAPTESQDAGTPKVKPTRLNRLALWITERVGTMQFFLLIFIWTVIWLCWNMFAPKALRFDPFPGFGMLFGCLHQEWNLDDAHDDNLSSIARLVKSKRKIAPHRQGIRRKDFLQRLAGIRFGQRKNLRKLSCPRRRFRDLFQPGGRKALDHQVQDAARRGRFAHKRIR